MFVIRDVFKLKFGKAKEFVALYSSNIDLLNKDGHNIDKMYSTYTGKYYTFIMEHRAESMAEYEEAIQKSFSDKNYEDFYAKVIPLVESGYREILKEVILKKK